MADPIEVLLKFAFLAVLYLFLLWVARSALKDLRRPAPYSDSYRDADYAAAAGTLTFAPGVTAQTLTVTVNGDTKNEADETFGVNLSAPTNATRIDSNRRSDATNETARGRRRRPMATSGARGCSTSSSRGVRSGTLKVIHRRSPPGGSMMARRPRSARSGLSMCMTVVCHGGARHGRLV